MKSQVNLTGKIRAVVREELDKAIGRVIDEFRKMTDEFTKMKDEVMGEMKTVREEQTILSSQHGRILDLEDKVEKLEKIHPRGQHASVI